MKRSIKTILALGAFLPFFSAADVNLTLHKDVEALIVNGESVPMKIIEKKQFSFPNGTIQLVVRVSKLVQSESEFEKFKTDPLVITFDAKDVDLSIEATRNIVAKRQIKDFEQNPSFLLVTNKGETIASEQVLLPEGVGLVRDHEKELAKFNQKRGIVIPGDQTLQAVAAVTLAAVSPVQAVMAQGALKNVAPESTQVITPKLKKQANVNSENGLILMKADFLRMAPQDKKVFLQWAVKNVNS